MTVFKLVRTPGGNSRKIATFIAQDVVVIGVHVDINLYNLIWLKQLVA